MRQEIKGLKNLRKTSGSKPTYRCDNCACSRYSVCLCKRKKQKEQKDKI